MKLSLLSTIGILAISLNCFAQNPNSINKPILLLNHTIEINGELNFSAPINGKHYAIVQLPENISRLTGVKGVKMLDYLPKNAGIFSVESSVLDHFKIMLRNLNGQATTIAPEWKKSNRLFENNIPDYAWISDDKIQVWLGYFSDMNPSTAAMMVKQAGYNVVAERPNDAFIAVAVSPSEIDRLTQLSFVYYVQEREDPGQPENYTARTDHRVNMLQSQIPGTVQYDGSGVVVGHGDDGAIGPHIDFSGRLDQSAPASSGDHGDHVAGTIFGAGNLNPKGRGMAPGADLFYQDYPDNLHDVDMNYNVRNVRITNSSYSNGCNDGYTAFTRQMDQDVIDNPNLLHIFSAGNDGTSDCGYGAGSGWGNVTGGHKIAKNVIATANLNYSDGLSNSSSRGPATDGRIKPDISAVGTSVFSTTDPNLYTLKTGTSMAAPGVAGTAAVLYQAYRDHNGNQDPPAGLLKAIMLNGADDIGNPGPDFKHGYGRLNARKSFEIIESGNYQTATINNNGTSNFQIVVPPNTATAKIMLYWEDVPGSVIAARALVNDLDMTVNMAGTTFQPWVLDPTPNSSSLNSNAVQARDSLNNMEQITISNPISGDLTVTVDGYNLPSGTQTFYLVYYFEEDAPVLTYPLGGEGFVPGTTEAIRWDAPDGSGPFNLEYSADSGSTWQSINSTVGSNKRHYDWNVPNTPGNDFLVRISSNGQNSVSENTFSIIGRPDNIGISKLCPDSLQLTWNPVDAATGYIVYKLGQKYMDSIGFSTQPYYRTDVSNLNQGEWFSVAAVIDGSTGMRANAIQRTQTTLLNCTLEDDINVLKIISPAPGLLADCYSTSGVPVTVEIKNQGLDSIYNFNVHFQFNNGSTVTELITDTVLPGATYMHTFSGSGVSLGVANSNTISIWSTLSNDLNTYNDSLFADIVTYASTTVSFPYTEDFESQSSCGTASNCGNTVCNLVDGWLNAGNGQMDDIDFRANIGGTPSSGTGPNRDQLPGNIAGTYLYLEASGGCDSSEAVLMSPCIDLSTAIAPVMEFWYHMNGINMGTLSVDVYDGNEWHNNIIPKFSGNKGTQWNQAIVELAQFAGKTITLRFRGKTGDDFASDMALDHISLYENNLAPEADFDQNNTVSCVNGVVNFSDASAFIPGSWSWDIQPNTVTYINGTDSASQDISVQFHNTGTYQVTLVAINSFGSDTIVKTQAVEVVSGQALPFIEDFETSLFPPTGWQLDNPDNQSQWTGKVVTGSSGSPTSAAVFDNFNSGSRGQEDGLVTLSLDLTNVSDPLIFFDVAYSNGSAANSDSLIIDYSSDCGESFIPTAYAMGGSDLHTTSSQQALFIPSSATDWRRDTLDLSPYAGGDIKLRFRNVSNEGNLLYLDNIQVVSAGTMAPVADFGLSVDSFACTNDMIMIYDSIGGGTPDSVYWDFGPYAVPNSASTQGPHQIKYTSDGNYTITLTTMNAGGFSTHTQQIQIGTKPIAVMKTMMNSPQIVQFTDLSLNDPVEWLWRFGDGDSSTLQNPLHNYAAGGTYNVYLRVTNACGTTDRTQTIEVKGLGLEEKLGLQNLVLYPNPSGGIFNLKYESSVGQNVKVKVFNLTGKMLLEKDAGIMSGSNELQIDLSNHSNGLYMVKVETDYGVQTLKAIKK